MVAEQSDGPAFPEICGLKQRLVQILVELDELRLDLAAVKISEAIDALDSKMEQHLRAIDDGMA